MAAISITDLNNAKLDADHIAAIATSTGPTATDRLGHVKRTVVGAIADAVAQTGAFTTEAEGRAAVADGKTFRVQGSGVVASYEYRRTNSSTSVLIATYPTKSYVDASIFGRVQFSRSGTVFTYTPPDVAGSVSVGWSTLRFWKGDNNFRKVANRTLAPLVVGNALYIDVAVDAGASDYVVQEALLTSIAVDIVQGTKILLVGNYAAGYLMGEIAEAFVNVGIRADIASVQAGITALNSQTKWARTMFTASQSTYSYSVVSSIITVGWTGARLIRGAAGVENLSDVSNYSLANLQCLYVDMTQSAPLTPVEADYTSVAIDAVSGNKLILVANYFGGALGALAPFLRAEQVEAKAGAAQLNSYDARRIVAGTITSAVPSGSSFTVSISEGRSFIENNSGASEFKVAPVSDILLAPGEGLVVDFVGGALDGSGRYIPVKYIVAQSAASGWQTGKKYVLVGNLGFGSLFGDYRTAPTIGTETRSLGVHDGKVAFSTDSGNPFPTYDSSTRTLSWPELVIQIKDRVSPLSQRVKLQSGSIVIPSGMYWVVSLDLTQVDFTLTPSSAVSVGQYFTGGGSGEDEDKMPLFAVSADMSYPVCFPPTLGSSTFQAPSTTYSYSLDEVVVVQRADEVDIYMKGSNPLSNKYLRYRMQRKTTPTINSDVWRWNEVWEVARTGDLDFAPFRQICNPGENEMAIRQTGKSDYMGGTAHGDEELFSVTMLVDGVYIPLGGVGSFRCRRVEFLQASSLYEVDTVPAKSNTVAKSYKRWIFEAGEVEIFNRVVWEDSITLLRSFMTMLTFLRWDGALQISDRGYRSPLYLEESIGASYGVSIGIVGSGFVDGESVSVTALDGTGVGMLGTATVDVSGGVVSILITNNGSGYTVGEALVIVSVSGLGDGATGILTSGFDMVYTDSLIAKASGPNGYSAEVEILDGWDKAGRRFNFANPTQYNKFYFDYTGADYVTQIGEVFNSRARYKLDTKN